MAKGRQTHIIARASITAAVVEFPGPKHIMQWSFTRPIDPKSEKLIMYSTQYGDMQGAVTDMDKWLDEHYKGVK